MLPNSILLTQKLCQKIAGLIVCKDKDPTDLIICGSFIVVSEIFNFFKTIYLLFGRVLQF